MANQTQCAEDYDYVNSIIRLKTWIHDGYSPYKVGWFHFLDGLYGTGFSPNILWSHPGSSPSYIPTLYMADPYGNVATRNMEFTEDDGFGPAYTIYTGATNKFCVFPAYAEQNLPPLPEREIGDHWLAWPGIYSRGGVWWSIAVDDWS